MEFTSGELCMFNAMPVSLAPMTLAELDVALVERSGFSMLDLMRELGLEAAYDQWLLADIKDRHQTVLDVDQFQRLNARVRNALYVGIAIASGARYVFLEGRLLEEFLPEQRQLIRRRLEDRLLLVWRQPMQHPVLDCDYRVLLKNLQIWAILPGTVDESVLLDVYRGTKARDAGDSDSLVALAEGEMF
jgi:hypothetical protein